MTGTHESDVVPFFGLHGAGLILNAFIDFGTHSVTQMLVQLCGPHFGYKNSERRAGKDHLEAPMDFDSVPFHGGPSTCLVSLDILFALGY
jgi:hypothetical protein